MMGFIGKYLLPKEIDFNAALLRQATIGRSMVEELHQACVDEDRARLASLSATALQARELKAQNMAQLLDVFITPYDKESIYRMITQLDWVTLSVKHFVLETDVYDIHELAEYEPILKMLATMADALEQGIAHLPARTLNRISPKIDQIHDSYDEVVEACAKTTAKLLAQDDIKHIIRHKDILLQLKEIAKRLHVSANTLEDMAIKIV
ncbi:DUF47 domain-containing protein [Thiolapillus sp.]